MLSRTIVSVLAFSSMLGVASLAGAEAGGMSYGTACAAPFDNAENITSVTPYKVTQTNLKHSSTRLEGAVVTVAAQPGLTREWLQRQVSAPPAGRQNGCPLAVNGATARVTSTGDGFAITVSSPDRTAPRRSYGAPRRSRGSAGQYEMRPGGQCGRVLAAHRFFLLLDDSAVSAKGQSWFPSRAFGPGRCAMVVVAAGGSS